MRTATQQEHQIVCEHISTWSQALHHFSRNDVVTITLPNTNTYIAVRLKRQQGPRIVVVKLDHLKPQLPGWGNGWDLLLLSDPDSELPEEIVAFRQALIQNLTADQSEQLIPVITHLMSEAYRAANQPAVDHYHGVLRELGYNVQTRVVRKFKTVTTSPADQ